VLALRSILLLSAALVLACGEAATPGGTRVLVVGLDGATNKVIAPPRGPEGICHNIPTRTLSGNAA